MREIKFRAWGKNSKEFLTDGTFIGFTLKEIQNIEYIDGWEFSQYTGLKDKNGKEIYEGMEINNKFRVDYNPPRYVLTNISNGDIIEIDYSNLQLYEITREY